MSMLKPSVKPQVVVCQLYCSISECCCHCVNSVLFLLFFFLVLLIFQFMFLATFIAVDIPKNAGKLFAYSWLAQLRLTHCFGVLVGLLDGDRVDVLS